MFGYNPFATLSPSVSPVFMQAYVLLMVALVLAGTLFDMAHKRNAAYFFANRRKTRKNNQRAVGTGQAASIALQTAAVDVLASGEFCNPRRRVAHLLGMYGFLLYLVTTLILVFRYATPDVLTPVVLPVLWHVGALMVCLGGYWFWFFIRVDVAAEGHSPFRFVQADLFIVALIKSTTLALIWSWLQWAGSPLAMWALGLYLIATTVLFGSVAWSKFSHMFYKPAAAFQRRMDEANGSRRNLPQAADKPETFGSVRDLPQHY